MIEEAFGGERRIAATLTAATPLLLTGLAAAIAFRAGVFNVGAEGCFYLGGIVAAVAGYSLADWPRALLVPFALGGAAIVGGAWLVAPGLLRARLGVDEVVTTLMLNFIAIDLTSWLVDGPLLARGSANSATPLIGAAAELPRLLPPTTLHLGFLISLALVIAYGVWSGFAVGGFRTRLVGLNPRFSRAVGIELPRVFLGVMIASGVVGRARRRHSYARPRPSLRRRLLAGLRLHRRRDRAARPQLRVRGGDRLHPVRRAVVGGREHPALQQRADRDRRDLAGRRDDLRRRAARLRLEPAQDGVMINLFLHAAMLTTTPILLAAIGGFVNRMGGLVNLGLESMMLAGALVAVEVSAATGSAMLATVAAAMIGAFVGLLMSLIVTRLRANEIIVGLGFSVAVAGLVRFILKSAYGASGTYNPPGVAMLPRLDVPVLDGVPILGALLSQLDPLTWLAWALVPAVAFALARTRSGLRLRATGAAEATVRSVGLAPLAIRDASTVFAGALSGLAGAHLSIGIVGLFNEGITGGRGFIALAAFYFGRASAFRTALGALLFGVFDAAQIRLQGRGVPAEIVQTLPYVIVIVVLTGLGFADRRSRRGAILS